MAKKDLSLTAILAAAIVCGLLGTIHWGMAQQPIIPTPSVPEFTVKFVNASYGITVMNQYTGINETQQISNNSIEVAIKNQPFNYSNNTLTYQIYFNVRVKPHFSNTDNWTEVYRLENLTSSQANANGIFSYSWYMSADAPPQSSSSYTTITFAVIPTNYFGESGYDILRYYSGEEDEGGRYSDFLHAIPDGGQLDFQIEALVGYTSQKWVIQHYLFPTFGGYFANAIAYDSTSGWSNAQTITIGETAAALPTPTLLPTATPTASLTEPPASPAPDATAPPSQPAAEPEDNAQIWLYTIITALLGAIAMLLIYIALTRTKSIQNTTHLNHTQKPTRLRN